MMVALTGHWTKEGRVVPGPARDEVVTVTERADVAYGGATLPCVRLQGYGPDWWTERSFAPFEDPMDALTRLEGESEPVEVEVRELEPELA